MNWLRRCAGVLSNELIAELARLDLRRLAAGKRHVLVAGETGTGKELAARRLPALNGMGAAVLLVSCAARHVGVASPHPPHSPCARFSGRR